MTLRVLFSNLPPLQRTALEVSDSRSSMLALALILCISLLAVTGCGQKGPLLLPESAAPQPAPASPSGNGNDEAESSTNSSATDSADGGTDGATDAR